MNSDAKNLVWRAMREAFARVFEVFKIAAALLLMAAVLTVALRLVLGLPLVSLPRVDHVALAYVCGGFWALCKAVS